MRTNLISAINSEKRQRIVKSIFDSPKRQWSCSALEDTTKLSHATVFRTLSGLKALGILKSIRINRKDVIYELTDSPLVNELKRLTNIEELSAEKIAERFITKVKSKVESAILYGSAVKGNMKPESDIDVLLILKKHDIDTEKNILDIAAEISSKVNKTLSVTIMDKKEIERERKLSFMKSIKEKRKLLYGKDPF